MKKLFILLFIFGFIKTEGQSVVAGWPATDALGRKLAGYREVGPPKKDKFVGIFYWTWHTRQAREDGPYNTSKILAEKPAAINDYNDPVWPAVNTPFYWGEPLFGYYKDTDEWVLRKHAEMLADAGVDVVVFDCTNGNITWKESYTKLCEVFTQARRDGVHVPRIAFMLAFGPTKGSLQAIEKIYTNLYKPGLYKDLWFYWKGKPLIIAYPEMLKEDSSNEAITALHREIRNFFTFRPGQPLYNKGPQRPDHWGWLEIYPQHGFAENPDGTFEEVTVGVAQNWSKARGLTAMNAPGVFGRSYTHAQGLHTEPGAVNYGYNFQEQWERALSLDPEFIFITGWNEWIAGRYREWMKQENAFPDEFSQEGSRDIEPMKGGHGDDYYYQMVNNIRRFKGMPAPVFASAPKHIVIDGKFNEWAVVKPSFTSYSGNTFHRNAKGWGHLHYINNTGRNDIVKAKVSRDKKYIYFYVETKEDMSSPGEGRWMRLFIDIDRNKASGWEGYDFVINRISPSGKALLERSEKGWEWHPAGRVSYAVSGNKMEIKVPRSLLGLRRKPDFEFKWSDNMQQDGNIMDFWVNGDVAPGGRFNYHYRVQ